MIEQVIMNLCINARDAMPKGGPLNIGVKVVKLDASAPMATIEGRPGSFACLSVTDEGCGMAEETQQRIFEPFFTTKEVGKGTGLGLSMVFGIVHQCQGCIELDSAPGKGAEFRIYFRVAAVGQPAQPSEHLPLPTGTETVLIVEDEPAVRALAARILGSLGYHVREASSQLEGIAQCRNLDEPVHLLLVDLGLPDGNGVELVAQVRGFRKDFKVLYATGFGSEQATLHGVRVGKDDVIGKPYVQDSLARKVRQVLDA